MAKKLIVLSKMKKIELKKGKYKLCHFLLINYHHADFRKDSHWQNYHFGS